MYVKLNTIPPRIYVTVCLFYTVEPVQEQIAIKSWFDYVIIIKPRLLLKLFTETKFGWDYLLT